MILNLSKIRLIIFDFDGVLIQRMPDQFPASLFEGFIEKGDTPQKNSVIRLEGTNWINELEKLGIDIGNRETLATISRKILEYNKDQLNLYDWVPRLIPELAKTQKLAILTNNSLATVKSSLKGLESHFSAIKTWENVPKLKPAPDGLLCICRELCIAPSETLMMGDSEEDFIAANKAKVMSFISAGEHLDQIIKKY